MFVTLALNALAFYVTASIVPGFTIRDFGTLLVMAVVWGILTLFIRPILVVLTLPMTVVTLGLFTFVINAVLLLLLSSLVPGFVISGFGTAIVASIVMAVVHMFLSLLKH